MKTINFVLTLLMTLFIIVTNLHAEIFMWDIQGGKNNAYLLGSIHIMPEDTYPLDDKIENAFKKADVLVVEVDITTIDQGKIQTFIAEKACYEEGKNLQTEIPAEMYKSLSDKFEELGVPMTQIDIYKPWFVSMNLGLLSLQKLNVTAGQGIDLHFLNQANEKEMEILDLETAGAQLEILASNPDQVQIDYLQYSIEDYEQGVVVFMEMLEAWKTGDTEKMNKVSKVKMLEMGEELPGIIDFYNKLFTERDEKILQKIIEHLENEDDHTYFIIVGALHLVGEDGLIKLLNNKGYKTKQY